MSEHGLQTLGEFRGWLHKHRRHPGLPRGLDEVFENILDGLEERVVGDAWRTFDVGGETFKASLSEAIRNEITTPLPQDGTKGEDREHRA